MFTNVLYCIFNVCYISEKSNSFDCGTGMDPGKHRKQYSGLSADVGFRRIDTARISQALFVGFDTTLDYRRRMTINRGGWSGRPARESRISMRKSIDVVDISSNNRRRNKKGSASL